MKKSLRIWVALVALLLSGGARAQDFNPKIDYFTGSGPASVAVGDFNADGKPDLATANRNDNTVSVLPGDGAGGFLARTDYPTGTNPYSVAVGDFNADGKPDLAVANYFGNTVSVLPGNGAGGFLARTDYPTGTNPFSVAVSDFNADGKPDLATANQDDNTVSVLLNATCTTPTAYAVTGGGAYCAGGAGLAVGLTNSQSGVNYQLKRDNNNAGAPVAGTGAAISFGNQILAGSYTVTATNATTSCTADMSGSATVSVNPLPTASIATNNGPICAGGNATFSVSGSSGATLTYTLTGQSGNQTLALNGGSQTITASGATANATFTLVSVANSNCSRDLLSPC